jgi:hypothetical protein
MLHVFPKRSRRLASGSALSDFVHAENSTGSRFVAISKPSSVPPFSPTTYEGDRLGCAWRAMQKLLVEEEVVLARSEPRPDLLDR